MYKKRIIYACGEVYIGLNNLMVKVDYYSCCKICVVCDWGNTATQIYIYIHLPKPICEVIKEIIKRKRTCEIVLRIYKWL